MSKGKLTQSGCKHHTLNWNLNSNNLKDLFDKKVLKVSFKNMDDEIDFYLEIDAEDDEAFLVNQNKETK